MGAVGATMSPVIGSYRILDKKNKTFRNHTPSFNTSFPQGYVDRVIVHSFLG